MNIHSQPPAIQVLTTITGDTAEDIRRLFDEALPLEDQDDRFDSWPSPGTSTPSYAQTSAVATIDDRVVGYLGGPINDGQAELDALVHPSIDQAHDTLKTMVGALRPELLAAGADRAQLWGRPARSWHGSVASEAGGAPTRALHQMRCHLPVSIAAVESRAFEADRDLDDLREVNNRAFASHPDQGHQTNESLLATMAEPWFRPDGIRIHERDGRMAGFCWTKLHPPRSSFTRPDRRSEPLGEIYVIGVDPDFHGKGLGAPMTAAGLEWMYDQGLEVGMLYVEADNVPAVKTYERLGFTVSRTDRAWSLPLDRA